VSGPLAAQASPMAATTESSPEVFEGGIRVGLMLPGTMWTYNWFRTDVKASPTFALDSARIMHRLVSVGTHVQLTPFSFDRVGDDKIGEGDGFFASVDVAVKVRLQIHPQWLVRGGVALGVNTVSYAGDGEDGRFKQTSSLGLSVGVLADLSFRCSQRLAITLQVNIIGQPAGSANLEGYPTSITGRAEGRKFVFTPLAFLSIGPELRL
jgi:hypothetical protein